MGGCGVPFLPAGIGGKVGNCRNGGGGRDDLPRDGSGGGCLEERGVEGGDGGPFLCCAVNFVICTSNGCVYSDLINI